MPAPEAVPELDTLLELWRTLDAAFERVEPSWWGAVVADRRYPAINEANYARVETRTAVRLAEIEAGLGDAGADPRSHVVVFHPEEQTDLLAEAGTAGARLVWDRVLFRRGTPTEPPADRTDVRTEEIRRFDGAFWRAHAESTRLFDVEDPQTLEQLQALERETLIPHGRRWFVVPGPDGPVAFASLLVAGDAAFLDHVVTFPRARRRGYAEALTRRAIAEAAAAGAASTFLLAEPDRPPERIYRRVGFERAGYLASWTRDRGG